MNSFKPEHHVKDLEMDADIESEIQNISSSVLLKKATIMCAESFCNLMTVQ